MAVKLQGPISPSAKAKRAKIELAAKAIIAKVVKLNSLKGEVAVIMWVKSDIR